MSAVDPPAPAGSPAVDQAALLAEATARSGLVWVGVPGRPEPPRPVWHLWHAGAVWLLLARTPGSPEQAVPGLLDAARVRVTVRSRDKGGRLVTYDARVEPLAADAADGDDVLPLLVDKRLNVPGGAAAAPERWRQECVVVRLVPELPLVEGPGALPTGDLAAPPPPSPARTPTPSPPPVS